MKNHTTAGYTPQRSDWIDALARQDGHVADTRIRGTVMRRRSSTPSDIRLAPSMSLLRYVKRRDLKVVDVRTIPRSRHNPRSKQTILRRSLNPACDAPWKQERQRS
jgi:hypothetical protein